MTGQVVRFPDPERRSRNPDAEGPRDPAEPCIIIFLPMIRVEPDVGAAIHKRR